MKRLREYHIESYWAAEAVKRKKKAEIKEKLTEAVILTAFFILEGAITVEFLRQLFEII